MNQEEELLGVHQKALRINLDASRYGTFAEIGAGQEVARWFFRVGGASGTIAKTISAYDMTISDAIYGRCERYVSRERLRTMLDYEFGLMLERLRKERGDRTKFFAFANTVAAQSFTRRTDSNGWMGIRFQTQPNGEPSEIIIHVRMWDKENVQQQEALGMLGVNLIYGAFEYHADPGRLMLSLMDNLSTERVEVDMIKFSGPGFRHVDNRLMSLRLVENSLTNAAMFTADGDVVQAAEVLYKKAILVERGSFRPVTKVTIDMLESAQAQFVQEPKVRGEDVVVLMEMTLKNLSNGGDINHRDFLDRVDILGALGKTVLISNYAEFHRLAAFLFRYTKKMIGIVMGVPTLQDIFDERYYADLEGGILESFGRLFKNDLKFYVYPLKEPKTGALVTACNLSVAPHLQHLYSYLLENHFVQGVCRFKEEYLPIFSRDALANIQNGDSSWEEMVPPQVARLIKERKLLGYNSKGGRATATKAAVS